MPLPPATQLFAQTGLSQNPILSSLMVLSQQRQDNIDRQQAEEQQQLQNERQAEQLKLQQEQLKNQTAAQQAKLKQQELQNRVAQNQFETKGLRDDVLSGTLPIDAITDPVSSALASLDRTGNVPELEQILGGERENPFTGETDFITGDRIGEIKSAEEERLKRAALPSILASQQASQRDFARNLFTLQRDEIEQKRQFERDNRLHSQKLDLERARAEFRNNNKTRSDLGIGSITSKRIKDSESFVKLREEGGGLLYDWGTGVFSGKPDSKERKALSQVGVVPVDKTKVDSLKQELTGASTALINLERAAELLESKHGSLNGASAKFNNAEEMLRSVLTDSEYSQLVSNSEAFATSLSPLITGENPSRLTNEDRRIVQKVAAIQPNLSTRFLARQLDFLRALPSFTANSRFARIPDWQRKELFDANEFGFDITDTSQTPVERAREIFGSDTPKISTSLTEKIRAAQQKLKEGTN